MVKVARHRIGAQVVTTVCSCVALALYGSFGSDAAAGVAYVCALGLPALVVLQRASSMSPTTQRAFAFVGGGMVSWTLAGALATTSLAGVPELLVSLLYVAGYPLVLVGLALLGGPKGGDRRMGRLIDGLLMFCLLYAVLWLLVVEPAASDSMLPTLERAFSAVYPAGDLALLMMAARLVVGGTLRPRVGWLILLGTALGAVADFSLLALYLSDPFGSWPLTDVSYLVSLALIAVAVLVFDESDLSAPASAGRDFPLFVPVCALAPACVLVAVTTVGDRSVHAAPLAVWLLAVACLMVWRVHASVRERQSTQRELEWFTTHDAVTGAYEPRAFLDVASRGGMRERTGTVLVIELDDFATTSTHVGVAATDELVVEVTSRLQQALGEGVVLGRMSHAEFAAFVRSSDLGRGRILAETVRNVMGEPIVLTPGGPEQLTVSIGVAQADGAVIDLEAGLRRAAAAMRHAKQGGPGRIAVDAELAGTLPVDSSQHETRPLGDVVATVADTSPPLPPALLRAQ